MTTDSRTKPTHLRMMVEVLLRSEEPLNDEQLVDALDREFPHWTKAKDRKGRIGIVHRVISLAALQLVDGGPFEKADRVGGKARWRLRGP